MHIGLGLRIPQRRLCVPAASFEGILDQLATAPVGAWSVARRLTADYEGSLIRLRRASDNAESDFGYDGDGVLDTAAIASWIGGSSGRTVTIYDQIGTDHLTMATAGTQPGYDADEIGGKPCADFSATGRALIAGGAVAAAFSGNDTYRVYAGVCRIKSGAGSSTFMGTTNADGSKVYNPMQDVSNNGTIYANFDGLFNLAGPYESFNATPKNVCLFSAYGADKINLWWGSTKKLDDQTLAGGACTFTTVAIGCWWANGGINNSGSCWWSELIAFAADARADQAAYAADVASFYGVA